jgi:hypothetical protein
MLSETELEEYGKKRSQHIITIQMKGGFSGVFFGFVS